MEFKVKKDFLLIFIIDLLLLLLIGISLPFTYNTWVFIVVFGICFAMFCFFNTSVIFASCKLSKKKIIYRTGAFKYDIPLKDIVTVEKAKNLYSSLALSVNRIRILTKKNNKQKVYYISIFDEDQFIDLLTKKEETPTPIINNQSVKEEIVKNATRSSAAKKTISKGTTSGSKKTATKKK